MDKEHPENMTVILEIKNVTLQRKRKYNFIAETKNKFEQVFQCVLCVYVTDRI